jgi:hypothetical protein
MKITHVIIPLRENGGVRQREPPHGVSGLRCAEFQDLVSFIIQDAATGAFRGVEYHVGL